MRGIIIVPELPVDYLEDEDVVFVSEDYFVQLIGQSDEKAVGL